MARKSRKYNTVETMQSQESVVTWKTAIYARLSSENGGKGEDSDTLFIQINYCKEYVQSHPDMELVEIYEDNGETGTNFSRPAFEEMMNAIRCGKVNCIIVKDLSRFGRDYIDAGNYIDNIFPFLKVRFVAINDRYDSEIKESRNALSIPLKNMINTMYAKDISRKVVSSFIAKQERGEFLGSMIPYGYMKSTTEKYRYAVDPEAAGAVKLIYEWRLAGFPYKKIAKFLTELGYPSPQRRKKDFGFLKNVTKDVGWTVDGVRSILRNPTYTGCMIHGKFRKNLSQNIPKHVTKKEEWIVIPNCHEPLVSKETFEAVEKIFEETTKKKHAMKKNKPVEDLLKGKIFCADCGSAMSCVRTRTKGQSVYRYRCRQYLTSRGERCTSHSIRQITVYDEVTACIVKRFGVHPSQKKEEKSKEMKTQLGLVRDVSNAIKSIDHNGQRLFESYCDGILTLEEYKFAKEEYARKKEELTEKMTAIEKKVKKLEREMKKAGKLQESMRVSGNANHLTQEMADTFVERVVIHLNGTVEVHLKEEDGEVHAYEE